MYLHCSNTVLAHAIDEFRDAILNELRKNENLTKLQSLFIDNNKVDKPSTQNVDNSKAEIEYA
ncbi:hypothetical protein J6P04_01390 [bacterium]|nr:hypothetical protein [bacterium]